MADKKRLFTDLKAKVDEIVSTSSRREQMLKSICRLLAEQVDYYDWVGFYLVDQSKEELVLGPYVGAPTEHVRIPFGRGICGRAAVTRETIVIQDVSKVTNYLACAPDVLSEIVVPIINWKGDFVGELDIDSLLLSPFSYEDRDFLKYICRRLAQSVDFDKHCAGATNQ